MRIYSYFRSSTSYRVRIALNLKGLSYDIVPVNLLGSEQTTPDYREVNAFAAVPALETGGATLVQSMAILEWLEETKPTPPLWPTDPVQRAQARALAYGIACDLHPINNLRVLNYLKREFDAEQDAISEWYKHWVAETFSPLEDMLNEHAAAQDFPFGAPGGFEVCLVPQMYNARRFDCDLSPYPRLVALDAACRALPAFHSAAPEQQIDAK
ncbi:MAG: maleylacetoacetate isomerase [Pseudomonadota bacterium]